MWFWHILEYKTAYFLQAQPVDEESGFAKIMFFEQYQFFLVFESVTSLAVHLQNSLIVSCFDITM